MGNKTTEARAQGRRLMELQRRAGIRSNAGADSSQTRDVQVHARDVEGNPTLFQADHEISAGEIAAYIAIGRAQQGLPLSGFVARNWVWGDRIDPSKQPLIIGA